MSFFFTFAVLTMASRLVSRGGGGYPASSQGTQRPSSSLCCNRCRKSLTTTVFVCTCDCVFCEECTYEHFNSSSNCPNCGKTLGANDFMELCVADPSSATQETTKNTFQNILTKYSSNSKALSHQEMCSRLLKNLDNDRRAVRFLMKQFVFDSSNQGQRQGNMGRAYEQLKQENTQLKQSSSSQRIQYEQTIADLQHRVQALNGSLKEQQKNLEEKENQIAQFRQLYAADGMARMPSSSHSQSSGGKRGRTHHAPQQQPPMQSFIMQKEAAQRAKEQALGEITRARGPPMRSSNDSVITPIQLPQHRPQSTDSAFPPATPRIRDLSSSSGYVFTSRSSSSNNGMMSKRPRSGQQSPAFYPQQQRFSQPRGFRR